MNIITSANYDKAPLGMGGVINSHRKDLSEGSVLKMSVSNLEFQARGSMGQDNLRYKNNANASKDFDEKPSGPQRVMLNYKDSLYGLTDPKLMSKQHHVNSLR